MAYQLYGPTKYTALPVRESRDRIVRPELHMMLSVHLALRSRIRSRLANFQTSPAGDISLGISQNRANPNNIKQAVTVLRDATKFPPSYLERASQGRAPAPDALPDFARGPRMHIFCARHVRRVAPTRP